MSRKNWLGTLNRPADESEEGLEELLEGAQEMDQIGVHGVADDPLLDEEPLPTSSSAFDPLRVSWFAFLLYFLGLKKVPEYTALPGATPENDNVWPERHVNYISQLLYSWFGDLLFLGFYKPLQHSDLWLMDTPDTALFIRDKFVENWEKHSPSLLRTLHHTFGMTFYSAAIPKFIYDCLQFVGPWILGLLITYLGEAPDDVDRHSIWYGVGLVSVLVVSYVIRTFLINIYFHINFRTGMHLRNATVTMIYEKSLRLSNQARKDMSTGQIVDLMSNDSQRLMNITGYLHVLWSGPFQIIVSLVMLFNLLGISTLAGFVYMLLLIPLNSFILRKQKRIRSAAVEHTDSRVRWTNEVLQAIRAVKQYCFEINFVNRILNLRELELAKQKIVLLISAFNGWVTGTAPVMVCVLSLTMYIFLGNPLTADVLFPAITLFNMLRFPLAMFPSMVSSTAEVMVSIKRIQGFLLAQEMAPMQLLEDLPTCPDGRTAAIYTRGDFAWEEEALESDSTPTLRKLRVLIPEKGKVGIIGPVGAGKSSFISTLLGELYAAEPRSIGIVGTTSLVPQQAWIMNATVRDNILFGLPFDRKRYARIVEACALLPDFAQLASGDQTEIGEKGINLSGGQKQRISIARALYQDTDIYLLDDPLSAVDAHVAKHIFEQVVLDLLKDKTVLLVTHYLHLLPQLDHVISLRGGEIEEQGSYGELMAANATFSRLVREYSAHKEEEEEDESMLLQQTEQLRQTLDAVLAEEEVSHSSADLRSSLGKSQSSEADGAQASLMETEERETGAVKVQMFMEYLKSAHSYILIFIILGGSAAEQVSKILTDWWLSYWSEDPLYEDHNLKFYFSIYLAWCAFNSLASASTNFTVAITANRCSRTMHYRLLNNIMRAPISFFESTPLGRILNRFAKDIDNIDTTLPSNMSTYLRTTMICVSTLALICVATPIAILPLIPIMFIYYRVQQYYRSTSRELKRLDSISKSPIFAHFSETLGGISSIRAYRALGRFITSNENMLDYNNRAYFSMVTANRWLSVRLETISTGILAICGYLIVLDRGHISPSTAGLVLSYTFSVTGWLSWLVRTTADTEQSMNSVERVLHYSELPNEAALEINYVDGALDNWPSEGRISFKQSTLKYRADLENAMDRLSLEIKPREKVGVCGRTGAGKSTILVALFRLVELYSGSIEIDGIDISEVGLHTLRSRLAIIPQDPVLFTGTIRSNLDCFDEYTDAQVWEALAMVQLKSYVETLPGQLDYQVTEMGTGFSVGQRQLLSFARALLGRVQILLLDEATASCDLETDSLIQQTLREKFVDCTVITIAHRLNTIMDSDRILVMSRGRAVEYDKPWTLLSNPDSYLSQMVAETGDAAPHLRELARSKFMSTEVTEGNTTVTDA